jgi:hypothetical protein
VERSREKMPFSELASDFERIKFRVSLDIEWFSVVDAKKDQQILIVMNV